MYYDIIIIGAGPAGISASLYAVRANKKVLVLYDDKITIMYNTSLNPGEEIYHINTKNDTTDDNDDGTTIYNKEVEIIEEENKKLPFEFKRQLFGGE